MAEVELRGIRAGFGGPLVLDGVDLTVPSGSIAAVLGPSGCGKTTLLRTIAGFHQPLDGRVRMDGRVVASSRDHVRPERRGVGILPQEGALFPHLSVAGNVAFGLGSGRGSRERVEEMLDLVGLSGFGRRMPQELSGGQQQRVALARALAPRPRFVLLDEPFSSLDAGLRTELREDVVRVLRVSGTTAMLVTHDQAEAMSMADLVAVMRGGRIAQVGEPREVYARPADLDVALLLGDVIVLDASSSGALRCCGLELDRTDGAEGGAAGADPHPPVAMLRPEQVRVRPASENAGEQANAVVTDVHFYGHDAAVLLQPLGRADSAVLSNNGRLRARAHGPTPLRRGSRVRVDIDGPAALVGGNAVAEWRSRTAPPSVSATPNRSETVTPGPHVSMAQGY
ncbi:ABC transporter ATP-binding protein [Nocardiopsis salina]|uniref:ABC transporter ATP-binding protein n=1 Tax=Nocardiopsis salina TaxID=245836 RepID=UPI000362F43E|nr:ABC transporter ATP-binding protein [Nocardiopsis salina]